MSEWSSLWCNVRRYAAWAKAVPRLAATDKGGRHMTDHSITGKTVLITGGAKNLGGLIARDLAEHGAKAIAIHYNSAGTQADADATVAAEIGRASCRETVCQYV